MIRVEHKRVSVNVEVPIKVYPDGMMWCALWGENLQSGVAGFGRSPNEALDKLLEQDELYEKLPHGVWHLTCPSCGETSTHVMPYPYPHDSVECPRCKGDIEVSNESASEASGE
ncbi:MAG: hypothetical protein AAGA75_09090 [Cyanobacteria bacterium P01_E01_bin.6]